MGQDADGTADVEGADISITGQSSQDRGAFASIAGAGGEPPGIRFSAAHPVGKVGWDRLHVFSSRKVCHAPGRAGVVAGADPSRWSSPANRMPAPAQLLSHQPDEGCTVMGGPAALGGKPKRPACQSCRSPDSSSAVRALPRRPFGRAGPPCSASSRRRERDAGLLSVWLSLAALVPVRTTERQRA